MKALELRERLAALHQPVFTINDLAKITREKKSYLKVALFRLKKRRLIEEIERGKYALHQHPYITGTHLIFSSYLSFLSAYSYYQLTTQIPKKIQVVALRSKKEMGLDNYKIEFIKFPPARMFGFQKERFMDKAVIVAEKEKAIIDSLYLPRYCPLDETFFALEEPLDTEKLINYALRMNSQVLLKRLGYLLELRGIDISTKVHFNQRYDRLDPTLPFTREKSKKWKLIINRRLHAE